MKFTPKIEEILKRLDKVNFRELAGGFWEIYHSETKEVLATLTKAEVDSAIRRLNFKKAQKKRKKGASW